jgi:vacuolar protein 8
MGEGERMVEPQQEPEPEPERTTSSSTTTLTSTATWKQNQTIQTLSEKLTNGNLNTKIEAAREIRRMVRKSSKTRSKIADAGVIQPLIFMLSSSNIDARQSSLLALLNLAVRNERYKDLFFFLVSHLGFAFAFMGIRWIMFSLCNGKWVALNL